MFVNIDTSADGHRSVAIVGGVRTPFAKRGAELAPLSALQLGTLACTELMERLDLDPEQVQRIVFGQVIPSLETHNIAREIVLAAGLAREIPASTVSQACITGYRATVDLLWAIESGWLECGIAGGAESASRIPMAASDALRDALLGADDADSALDALRSFRDVRPGDLVPRPPDLKEPSTGESMGEAGERMAKENRISREAQDELAHRSHVRAAAAWEDGRFGHVMAVHVPPEYRTTLERDGLVRPDSDLAAYADLDPVFDPDHGTVTAGNSSPLTDGAAALALMRTDAARAAGIEPLGHIRSVAFTALDPADQLLLGPAYALPLALDRASLTLGDLDLVDVHEAFASTVLSVLEALESRTFARDELGRPGPVGRVDPDRLNTTGGSIALGHPFAATGARQIMQTLAELRRTGGRLAACTACAAGGMAAAVILEAA